MKKTIILLAAASAIVSCGVDDIYYGEMYDPSSLTEASYDIDWDAAADSVDVALIENFMVKEKGIFWVNSDPSIDASANDYNYWGQAHAMDVIIDAYLRIGDTDPDRKAQYENYMSLWHENRANNYSSPGFKNNYTDDMEWIVLTLIRMYEATAEQKYLDSAKETYDSYIITRVAEDIAVANGTTDPNGKTGLRWFYDESHPLENYDQGAGTPYSLNACSNGPGALCALRLYEFTQEEQYLDDAKQIYEWLSSILYDSTTGSVSDNISEGVVSGGALSYNQGTFLGAAHMLYTFTGDERYLIEAKRAAEYQMSSMSTDGIMNSEASEANSDNALFKGIFIRYATLLALDENVDAALRQELSDYMTHNAIVCWTQGVDKSDYPSMFFNYDWTQPYTDYYAYYQPQVSASTLIEAMTRLH